MPDFLNIDEYRKLIACSPNEIQINHLGDIHRYRGHFIKNGCTKSYLLNLFTDFSKSTFSGLKSSIASKRCSFVKSGQSTGVKNSSE